MYLDSWRKMGKLSMCRICTVENVRMHEVSNKNLQEIYEKLTDIPFITEDRRPMLACYFCYAKLQQLCRFKKQCLDAEKLFAQMLNSHEQKPLLNRGNPDFVGGFVKTPVENISIVNDGLAVAGAIEIELPPAATVRAVSERPYQFIEVKVEHESDELEPEYPDVEDFPAHHSDSEDDVPLLKIKTEVEQVEDEEQQEKVAVDKRTADDTKWTPVAEKPKHNIRRTKLEDKITPEQKKTEQQGSKAIQATRNHTLKPATEFENVFSITERSVNNSDNNTSVNNKTTEQQTSNKEKPFKCTMCHRSYTVKSHLTCHIRTHTGEKPYECEICHRSFAIKSHLKCHVRTHTGLAKPFKCDVCQRSFSLKNNLRTHVLTHTGEKPYKCHICARGFTQKIHLRSHIPIHTGDKPFKCEVCDRSFSLKHSLKRHIKIHDVDCKSSYNLKSRVKK